MRKTVAELIENLLSTKIDIQDSDKKAINDIVNHIFDGIKKEIKQEEEEKWGTNIG